MFKSPLVLPENHTQVPEDFDSIHHDLRKMHNFWFERGGYVFTVIFVAILILFSCVREDLTFGQCQYLMFIPICFFLIAWLEAEKVNKAVSRYASYIVKTQKPINVEVVPTSLKSIESTFAKTTYNYAFEILGEYPQTVRAYYVTTQGCEYDTTRLRKPSKHKPFTAEVWFDPVSHEAIMLHDFFDRYWLQQASSVVPTGQAPADEMQELRHREEQSK